MTAQATVTSEERPLVTFALFPCIPFAYSLAIKDLMQGKVRKTHREFQVATEVVKIDVQVLTA